MLKDPKNILDRIICDKCLSIAPIPTQRLPCRKLFDAGITGGAITVLSSPYELWRNGRERPYHYMIWYALDGVCEIDTPTESLVLSPGSVMLIPSWIPRNIRLVEGDSMTQLWFRFRKDRAPTWIHSDSLYIQPSPELKRLHHAVEELLEVIQLEDLPAAELYCDVILHFLQRGFRPAPKAPADEYEVKFQNLASAIRQSLAEEWPTERMAALIHVSRAQLFRLMKTHCGHTPNRFVVTERIRLACDLLANTDYRLSHIAEMTGYSTPYALSNTFTKHVGIRPREYRKRQQSLE